MQVLTEPHEVLDVKDDGKVDAEQLKEISLRCGNGLASQDLQQVTEVITTAQQEIEGRPMRC
jgi:hypothetical protein